MTKVVVAAVGDFDNGDHAQWDAFQERVSDALRSLDVPCSVYLFTDRDAVMSELWFTQLCDLIAKRAELGR